MHAAVAASRTPAGTLIIGTDCPLLTPGLIRHYFTSKDELVRTAYLTMMDRMTADSRRGLDAESSLPCTPAKPVFVAIGLIEVVLAIAVLLARAKAAFSAFCSVDA